MNIKSFNDKWVVNFEEKYRQNLPLLIDAFSAFFGEEHRTKIAYVLGNVRFMFYISEEGFETVKSGYDICTYMMYKEFFKSLDQDMYALGRKRVSKDFIAREYAKRCLYGTISDSKLFNIAKDSLNEGNLMTQIAHEKDSVVQNYILVPIYFGNDRMLIHDLNHCFDYNAIFSGSDKVLRAFVYSEPTELLNEKMSMAIYEIFKSLNGKIFEEDLSFDCLYHEHLDLIDEFYEAFLPFIKESYITENTGFIAKRVGVEDYYRFLYLIEKANVREKIPNSIKKELHDLVRKMSRTLSKDQDYDYEAFFQELEKAGKRVLRLKVEHHEK